MDEALDPNLEKGKCCSDDFQGREITRSGVRAAEGDIDRQEDGPSAVAACNRCIKPSEGEFMTWLSCLKAATAWQ